MCSRGLISRGCKSYLTYIYDVNVESPSLNSITIVHYFSYVLPSKLLGIPLTYEIEFVTDLEVGTQPSFMAPYYLASIELKKINPHLQDLFVKGFY